MIGGPLHPIEARVSGMRTLAKVRAIASMAAQQRGSRIGTRRHAVSRRLASRLPRRRVRRVVARA
jgi:hypothetical protein